MQLGVSDAETSEEQIYAWIDDGSIPFDAVSEQYRFYRAELLEWATAQRRPVSVEIFHTFAGGAVSIGGRHPLRAWRPATNGLSPRHGSRACRSAMTQSAR